MRNSEEEKATYLQVDRGCFKEFPTNNKAYYEHGVGAYYWADVRYKAPFGNGSMKKHLNICLPLSDGEISTGLSIMYWSLPVGETP